MFKLHISSVASACRRYSVTRQPGTAIREESYANAVKALNTLQSNYDTVKYIQANPAAMHKVAMPEMLDWTSKAGYEASDFDRMNAIHIAGTKGKGSTSSFISSILAQYLPGYSASPLLRSIGLYTSPHLRFVRERIQINNDFITEDHFAEAFFEIWKRFDEALHKESPNVEGPTKPAYFRYLTILAFHTFLKLDVDTAVIECGMGGEYDSTNILRKPTVTGITSLGIDHTPNLGDTIDKIAWHKAGIMKAGAPAYTVFQPAEAMAVLNKVADERGVELKVVGVHPEVEQGTAELGLSAPFQMINASLAVEVAAAHLRALGHLHISTDELPKEFLAGLKATHIGGRCETRRDNKSRITWRIDGAHTNESIEVASKWYADRLLQDSSRWKAPERRMLLFNQQSRAGGPLLKTLFETVSQALKTRRPFTHVVFCTNQTYEKEGFNADLVSHNSSQVDDDKTKVQRELEEVWRELNEGTGDGEVCVKVSIEEAVKWCRKHASKHDRARSDSISSSLKNGNTEMDLQTEVFVTGSLHLVGGVLEVLESEVKSRPTAKSDS